MLERHDNLYLGPLFTIITDQGQVTTTMHHPFWVVEGLQLDQRPTCRPDNEELQFYSLPGRWVYSQHLVAGDVLYTTQGKPTRILEIRQRFGNDQPIHNLTIAETHNFSVGIAGILVHNTSHCSPRLAGNLLENARFAQKTYRERFSREGIMIYSKIAERKIITIDDLADAIRSGIVRPADVPVNIIRRSNHTLILNTRTAEALQRAGIPRSRWYILDRTGNKLFERMLDQQLRRSNLTSSGIKVPISRG